MKKSIVFVLVACLLAIGCLGYALKPEPPRQFRLQLAVSGSTIHGYQALSDCSLIRGNQGFPADEQGLIVGRLQPGEYAVVLSCQIALSRPAKLILAKDGAACLSLNPRSRCTPSPDFVVSLTTVSGLSPVPPASAAVGTGGFYAINFFSIT